MASSSMVPWQPGKRITERKDPQRPDAAEERERARYQRHLEQEQKKRSAQTTSVGKVIVKAKQPSRKRPPGAPGTNVHSTFAGISVHNALLDLGPPPPSDAKPGSKHLPWLRLTDREMMTLRKRMKKNAKWKPSDDMIKKELCELGRGPGGYVKAKEEAARSGLRFVDEDGGEGEGREREVGNGQDFVGLNIGMRLNVAKKRKREAHVSVPLPDTTSVEGLFREHGAKRQKLCESDALTKVRKATQVTERVEGHHTSAINPNKEGSEPHAKSHMPPTKAVEMNVRSGIDTTSHATGNVPIDLTDFCMTDTDASRATSAEDSEMSALSVNTDDFLPSEMDEPSAESSLGDGFLPPPETNSSDKPPVLHNLGCHEWPEMSCHSNTGFSSVGDSSFASSSSTSTGNDFQNKVGSVRYSSSRKGHIDHPYVLTPNNCRKAVLTSPATKEAAFKRPVSAETRLDTQARAMIGTAIARAKRKGDHPLANVVKDDKERRFYDNMGNHVSHTTQPANTGWSDVVVNKPGHPSEGHALLESSPLEQKETLPMNPVIAGPVSLRNTQGHDRFELWRTIESAVADAHEQGDSVLGFAYKKLYERSLGNPTIADLLVAVLIRTPTPEQSAQLASYVEAIRIAQWKHRISRSPWNSVALPMLLTSDLSSASGDTGSAYRSSLTMTSCDTSMSSITSKSPASVTASILPVSATLASSNTQSVSIDESPDPHNPLKLAQACQPSVQVNEEGDTSNVVRNAPTITMSNTTLPSASGIDTNAASNVSATSSNSQEFSTVNDTSSLYSVTARPPSRPSVPRSVPGGSGVMAWNRARRKARLSALANTNRNEKEKGTGNGNRSAAIGANVT